MPGQSKVNGAWRTITGLSVKVGGQWKTATSGYIKVGGQWKQWFASKIQDAFNRASTALGLGTADSGQAWNATRGNWRISGSNTAISDDAAANYALASINLGNTDVKIQTDTTGGVGPAFWVTDSGSWWASYPRFTSVTNTFCDQNLVTNFNNPPSGSCCSGVTTGTQSVCDQNQVTNQSNPPSGSCCSGVSTSGGGTACTGGLVTNQSNPPAGNCCSGVSQGGGGTSSVCDQSQVSGSSNPPAGNCCSGVSQSGGGTTNICDQGRVDSYGFGCPAGSCSGEFSETVTYYICAGGVVSGQFISDLANCCETPTYTAGGTTTTCAGPVNLFSQDCSDVGGGTQVKTCGGNTAGSNFAYCQQTSTSPGYWSCSTTRNGPYSYTAYYCYTATRQVTTPISYSCYTSTRLVNNPITYSCYTSYQQQPTYYSCYTSTRNATTYSCYTANRSVTTYTSDLVLVSSVSGNVVVASTLNLATNTTNFSAVGSVYVTTVGNTVTATAYSGSNLTGSQVGTTLSHTATNPTKGTSVGIIKGPSTGSQGSTTDNFLATI